MSELVLIDTSVWITALRVGGSVVVRQEVQQLLASSRAATTPIVMVELLSGTRSPQEFRELQEDLEALPQLALTSAVWQRAYRLVGLQAAESGTDSADSGRSDRGCGAGAWVRAPSCGPPL